MFLSIFLLRIIKRINILYYVRKLKYIMSFEQEANIELQEHVGDSAPQERYLKILLQITQTKINELMATSINQEGKFVTQIGLLNDKISELENFINEQDLSYKEQLKNKETDLQKSNKTNTKYKYRLYQLSISSDKCDIYEVRRKTVFQLFNCEHLSKLMTCTF